MAISTGPINNPLNTSFLQGAVYNPVVPVVPSGSQCALQCDVNGKLLVTATFSGSISGNAAAGPTGSAVPASADFVGFSVGGILTGVSASNPLPITGSVSATNPSVGTTGATAPTSATEIGFISGGNLVSPSSVNPLPVSGTVSTLDGTLAETTAVWNSSTALNTFLQVNLNGMYGSVTVTLSMTSTLTSGTMTWLASDTTAFTNAYSMIGMPTLLNGSVVGSAFVSANTNLAYVINVSGWAAFRVQLTQVIAGSGTVTVGITPSSANNGQVTANNGSVTTIRVESTSNPSGAADNDISSNFFGAANGAVHNLLVGDTIYGGGFSGTANAALQGWSKRRTPTVFKTIQATASGNTAIWTPGSGNKFRLLKVFVEVTDNASIAAGAVVTVSFQDGTTAMPIAFDVFIPTTAVTTVIGDGLEQELDLGEFGILSATANNVLNVNLSTVLATGNVRIIAMGCEE